MDTWAIIDYFYAGQEPLKELLLKHSVQVGAKAMEILEESNIKLNENDVIKSAMLHDIGIIKCHAPSILCNGTENYIAHGTIGAEMLRKFGAANGLDLEIYARIAERHTGSGLTKEDIISQNLPLPHCDLLPETNLEKLICYADKFFSKSGSMEEKSIEQIRRSMAKFGQESLDRFNALHALFSGKD